MLDPSRLLLLVLATGLAAACADGRASDIAAPSVPTWHASERPVLTIGADEGPAAYQFHDIAGARRTEDGTLVVADRGSKGIRVFDAEGRHLRTMGGAGGGPGEFRGLGRIFLLSGDSVAAWDSQESRLTVFAPGGDVARTETLPLPGTAGSVEVILEDGTLIARAGVDIMALIGASPGERRLPVTHLVRAPGAAEWVPKEAGEGREELVYRGSDGSVGFTGVEFGRDYVVGAGRRRWYTGETDRFEVTVRSPAGDEVGRLRRELIPQPVTRDMLERARAERRAASDRSRREIAQRMGPAASQAADPDLPHRSTLPAFDQVVENAEEYVWVRHYHFPSDAPQRWSVFSPFGELVAEAETPARLRVQQIGTDWILGVSRDDLGVEAVHLYTFSRG